MAKVTAFLISLITTLAHITPVTPFYIPPFLNHTNGTNTTYHRPQPPIPFPTTALGGPSAPCTGPGQPLEFPAPVSLNAGVEIEPKGPTFYRGSQNWRDETCGKSSFVGVTRATSALTSDCIALADDAAEERHIWYAKGFADNTTLLQIRNHGTCSFGIRPPYADVMYKIISGWYVGGMDVAQIVRTAVRDYDVNGQMGATGMMHCTISDASNADVQWAIFGPGEQADAGWWMAPPVPSSAGKKAPTSRTVLSAVAVSWLPCFWYIVS
ncbi:and nb-arc domain-containing protein [Colletotrichum incanum]|uniref:And nb-arc domain-containing protein n=1 Tax=Colletotrichum incanum TaxID=1573173 RepID=A0A166TJI9_COLIC|nr:and nb-arc domain-containing protein [Colletotrichum incanum]OHW99542.1 chitinase-like protein [Colletotrichum incanum]